MPDISELEEVEITSEELDEPEEQEEDLLRYQVTYYPSDITLKGYHDKWAAGQIVIPEFQRQYVWDQTRASKLIESFLLGIPVPGVFLYKEKKTNKLQVIDGQQRILSAVRFFEGSFEGHAFRLKKVQSSWEGKTFKDLTEPDQLQLQDAVLRATVVQQLDPDDNSSIFYIFERLNTGGVRLSPMEVRKCIYAGRFFALLEDLNTDPEWRRILGRTKADRRLRDTELVLRVLALRDQWTRYEKPMRKFLNTYMDHRVRINDADLNTLIETAREVFVSTCNRVTSGLGDHPFHLRGPLNLSLLDSVMAAVSRMEESDLKYLPDRFGELLADERFLDDVRWNTSDTVVVKRRFERAQAVLLGKASGTSR